MPGVRITIRTSVAPSLFDSVQPIAIEASTVDTGMAQIDSLQIDEDATARNAAAFYADFDRRVTDEAEALRRLRADVAIADIPPIAPVAAAAAGLPSIAVGNFTWDWIYSAYESFPRLAPEAIGVIRRAYAQTTLALRLPLHGGFDGIAAVRDIPLIARRSDRDRAETRRLLGRAGERPIVLPSFSAYGIPLAWSTLEHSKRFTVVRHDSDTLARHGLRYQDLVAAVDVVAAKPGYGIVTECIANGTALLYTPRSRFPEQDVFVAAIPSLLRCRAIGRDDFLAGRWDDDVDALLQQPRPRAAPRTDGAGAAADAIGKFLDR